MNKKMILIAAVSSNGVIGKRGQIPWGRIKEDMNHFRDLTLNHGIIMGSETYESLGKPLPLRENFVLSRIHNEGFDEKGAYFCKKLEDAIERASSYRKDGNFYVIGGGQVYAKTIDLANALEITEIHQCYDGDTYFPEIDLNIWKEVKREDRDKLSFVKYERR